MNNEPVLASRFKRLAAAIIDGIIIAIVTIPTVYFTGGYSRLTNFEQPDSGYTLFIGLLGIAAFLAINGRLLLSKGQTIGKVLLKIKIVDIDGNLPALKKNLLPRYAFYFIPGQVGMIGQLISLINFLFIFSGSRRCLHDYIGGTKVVLVD